MGSRFRYLLPALSNVTLPKIEANITLDDCVQYCKDVGVCHQLCSDYCFDGCPSDRQISRHKKLLMMTIILVMGVTSFLFSCYAMYVKYFRKSTSGSPQEEQRLETHDEFVDEDHAPVVDHPIWHIRTVGLQPSVISSITVCKYKRGDGRVEGTDCAVCLAEFDEDETLRLLPKCNHAFHIRCIDTWLEFHTNCPLCRAPIVTNTDAETSSEAATGNTSGTEEENRIAVLENIEESDTEIESEDGEIRTGTEEEGDNSRREVKT